VIYPVNIAKESAEAVDVMNGAGKRPAAREAAIKTGISVEASVTDRHPAGNHEMARVGLVALRSGRLHLQACFPERSINQFSLGLRLQTQYYREYLPTAAIHRHSF